uniref:Uncharacterized protein n=1 Tax=Lepeophtheirus salmonis TaxID=72036 RepID=A0A0K2U353_LEPSM
MYLSSLAVGVGLVALTILKRLSIQSEEKCAVKK